MTATGTNDNDFFRKALQAHGLTDAETGAPQLVSSGDLVLSHDASESAIPHCVLPNGQGIGFVAQSIELNEGHTLTLKSANAQPVTLIANQLRFGKGSQLAASAPLSVHAAAMTATAGASTTIDSSGPNGADYSTYPPPPPNTPGLPGGNGSSGSPIRLNVSVLAGTYILTTNGGNGGGGQQGGPGSAGDKNGAAGGLGGAGGNSGLIYISVHTVEPGLQLITSTTMGLGGRGGIGGAPAPGGQTGQAGANGTNGTQGENRFTCT